MLAPFGYVKAPAEVRPPAEMLRMADGYRWEMPDGSTAEKQIKLYAVQTWIATAVDHTANIAATALYSVKRVAGEPGGGDDEDLPNHDFENLLRRPNPSQSRGEFLRDAFTMFRVTGNLYIHLNRLSEQTEPRELWIVPSNMIEPIPDGRSYIHGYKFTPPGKAAEFIEPWQIMHLKTSNPYNPFVGLSALQSLVIDAYADLAQQKWNLAFFDKNNAKLPQILAFKHMVADPEWNKIKAERDSEWGGTNRSGVTLLRGVGDTLQLIQATATQDQMEFLEARQFTKEEIYGKLAPGLASILAVNATEANAKVGERILISYGVWPALNQMGEKFSSDLLPLYEENLDGAFDDIRPRELAEEEKFFTINEIRHRRFKAEPLYLDDSQSARLEEETAIAGEGQGMALEERDRQLALAKADFAPKTGALAKPDTASGTKPDKGKAKTLDPRGLMFTAQIGPATALPGDTSKPAAPAMPPMPALPPGKPDEGGFPSKDDPAKAADIDELEQWERFALKRLKKGKWERNPSDFETFVVPPEQRERIDAALKATDTVNEVRRLFAKERQSDLARLAAAIEKATPHL